MQTTIDPQVLDTFLNPLAECFTPEVALRILNLRAAPSLQTRIDELAEKANEGTLSETEAGEYAAYVEGIDMVGILQAKARGVLANSSSDSK